MTAIAHQTSMSTRRNFVGDDIIRTGAPPVFKHSNAGRDRKYRRVYEAIGRLPIGGWFYMDEADPTTAGANASSSCSSSCHTYAKRHGFKVSVRTEANTNRLVVRRTA